MSRRGAIVVALGVAVLLAQVAGAAGSGAEPRIAFASKLATYPPPSNLNVSHVFSVSVTGSDRRDLGPGSQLPQDVSVGHSMVAKLQDGELWLEKADGSATRRLLAPPAGQKFTSYVWSPNGRWLAALSEQEVWVTKLDGSGQRRLLTATRGVSWESFDWSPDNSRLAIGTISFANCGSGGAECADWFVDIVGVGGKHFRTIDSARDPAWSPSGKRILLAEGFFAEGESSVVLRRADGSALGELSVGIQDCWTSPAWSPDGRLISFVSSDCDEGSFTDVDVVIVHSSGPGRAREIFGVFNPGWSADGSRFLYFRGCGRDVAHNPINCNLFSAQPDGSHPHRLVSASPFAGVTWSPGGKRMALVSSTDAEGHGQIFLLNATGGGRQRLTHEPVGSIPAPLGWSHDGRRLLYRSIATQANDSEIWTMGPDGTDLKQVTSNGLEDVQPVWSPDHSRIAFARWSAPVTKGRQTESIYTTGADGKGLKLIVGGPKENDSAPAWSPDGSSLAFVRSDTKGSDVFLVNTDGTNVRRLTNSGGNYGPAWSPDGSEIAFADGAGISVIHPDGTGLRSIAQSLAGYFEPAWSPDGTELAVASSPGISVVAYADGAVHRVAAGRAARSPSWSPDGRRIAYAGARSMETCIYYEQSNVSCDQSSVYTVDAGGGTPVDVTPFPGVDSGDPSWFAGSPR